MREGLSVRYSIAAGRHRGRRRGRILQIIPPGVGGRPEPLYVIENEDGRTRHALYADEFTVEHDAGAASTH
jgi:hypothetical protein